MSKTALVILLVAACGGDGVSISGKLERVSASKGQSFAAAVADADEIWALPIAGVSVDRFSFETKQVVEVADDGSFEFVPERTSYDYVLALVDSSACGTAAPRSQWTDTDIDQRLRCIVGVVSIPDATGADAMSAVPVTQQDCGVDLKTVQSGGREARSTTSLDEAADCLTGDLEALQTIARADNTLLGIGNVYGNWDFEGNQHYTLNINYSWRAADAVDSAINQFASATDLDFSGYQFYFDTNVDVSSFADDAQAAPGYLKLTPPGQVSDTESPLTFGPSNPLETTGPWMVDGNRYSDTSGFGFQVNTDSIFGGVSANFGGITPAGEWRFERGTQLARADLSLVVPFAEQGSVFDETKPQVLIPVPNITATGANVESVEMKFMWSDGVSSEEVPIALALGLVSDMSVFLSDDQGCVEQSPYGLSQTSTDSFSWVPDTTWTTDGSAGCAVNEVGTTFQINGTTFKFSWRAPGF